MRRLFILPLLLVAAFAGVVEAGSQASLQPGAYEVRHRLELPHVEQAAVTQTVTICIAPAEDVRAIPFPVLSGNSPLASCPRGEAALTGGELTFEIACPGRGAARARAVYRLSPDRFRARIAMVMGGKNMTMTEVQEGRRIGECGPADKPR